MIAEHLKLIVHEHGPNIISLLVVNIHNGRKSSEKRKWLSDLEDLQSLWVLAAFPVSAEMVCIHE